MAVREELGIHHFGGFRRFAVTQRHPRTSPEAN
jgi:hypothetical protein